MLGCKYSCYVCEQSIKAKNYINHFSKFYNCPNRYLKWAMSEVSQPISGFRFEKAKCSSKTINRDLSMSINKNWSLSINKG